MATVVITAVEDIVLKGYCMMICNRNLFYEKRMALVCVRVCKKRFFAFVFCFMCQLSLCRFVSSINRSNAMACTGMKMQKVFFHFSSLVFCLSRYQWLMKGLLCRLRSASAVHVCLFFCFFVSSSFV
jgi:hypothetical protein